MTRFRPCIDLHAGTVKQIVGGTLTTTTSDLKTNYISTLPAAHYAELYRDNDCTGAHVIMLGPGNEEAASQALKMWPGKLQVGGGITDRNAREWIERGAGKVRILSVWVSFGMCRVRVDAVHLGVGKQVIITSFLFPQGKFSLKKLQSVLGELGWNKDRLVIDLSCRRRGETWFVAMDRWQTITEMEVNQGFFALDPDELPLSPGNGEC